MKKEGYGSKEVGNVSGLRGWVLKGGLALVLAFSVNLSAHAVSKKLPPKTVEELQLRLTDEFQGHNYDKVVEIYRAYVETDASRVVSLTARILYSQSLADTGDEEEAIAVLQEVVAELSPYADVLTLEHDLANLLFLDGHPAEAKDHDRRVLLRSNRHAAMLEGVRKRLALSKGRESRKKDYATLQMLEIESALETGDVPEGAETILEDLLKQKLSVQQTERARGLQVRIHEVRTTKASQLLQEARRLYDEERKYDDVREILNQLLKDYGDVCETQSVHALLHEVEIRSGRVESRPAVTPSPSVDVPLLP